MERISVRQQIDDCVDRSLGQLNAIWSDLGIVGDARTARENVVSQHLQNLLLEMVHEEEATKQRFVANVERFQTALRQLSEELQLPVPEVDSCLPVLHREKQLRLRVDELTKQRDERLAKLKRLSEADQQLCDVLCATPYYIPTGTVPTAQQLAELEEHVCRLEQEKENRRNVYHKTKGNILKLLEDLDTEPNTSFERDVVCEDEGSFLLNPDNMKELRKYHDELERRQETNALLAFQLREQIKMLWSRLDIPEADKTTFLSKNTGCKPRTIAILKDEVARCRLLKVQNLRQMIDLERVEIRSLWDKCYFGKEDREAFTAMYTDEFTEELLDIHESELHKLRAYYEQHKTLFDKVRYREELWVKFLNFEQMTSDPSRLFLNRGCNLLKEEKTRTKMQKDLPKVEQEVAKEIEVWEAATGNKFLMCGQTYNNYVASQWNEFRTRKELEKQQRLEQRAKQTEEEMKFGSKPVTPHKKRTGPTTGIGRVSKLRRINEVQQASPWSGKRIPNPSCLYSPSVFTTPSVTRSKPANKATDTMSSQNSVLRLPLTEQQVHSETGSDDTGFSQTTVSSEAHTTDPDATLAPVGHYQEFAVALNENIRSHCRSSIVPKPSHLF